MTKHYLVTNKSSQYFDRVGTLSEEKDFVYDPNGKGVVLDFKSLGDSGLWFAREEIEELDQ